MDDLPLYKALRPRSATIHVPKATLGKMAVDCLLEEIEGRRHIAAKQQVVTCLIERDPVAAAPTPCRNLA